MFEAGQSSVLPDFSADSLETWLSRLPSANASECCALLRNALLSLDEAKLNPVQRFQALSSLGPRVFLEAEKLAQLFFGKPFPLDPKLRKLAKLCTRIYWELADAYRRTAGSRDFSEVLPRDEQVRALLAAAKALEFHQFRLALVYEAPGDSLWESLAGLYRIGADLDLLSHPPGEAVRREHDDGLLPVLARILAFRLAVPTRLEQAEIRRLFGLLQEHGHLLVLTGEGDPGGQRAEFIADLAEFSLPKCASDQGGSGPWRLATDAFCAKLLSLEHPTVAERMRIAPALGLRIRVRLGAVPPFSLEQKTRHAVLTVGLPDLLVAFDQARGAGEASWLHTRSLEILPLNDHDGGRSSLGASKSTGTFLSAASAARCSRPSTLAGTADAVTSSGDYPCRVYRSESPGYYLLEVPEIRLAPGTVVSLNTDNKLRQIGVICCGQYAGVPRLYGLELLGSDTRPVRFHQDGTPTLGQSALLMQKGAAGEERLSLLMHKTRIRSGDALSLDAGGVGEKKKFLVSRVLEAENYMHLVLVAD